MNKKNTKFSNGMVVAEKTNGSCVVVFADGTCAFVDSKGILEGMANIKEKSVVKRPVWLKYFCIIGNAEREIIREWVVKQEKTISFVRAFLDDVIVGLSLIDYDYMIPTIEPSVNKEDMLYFKEGEEVCFNKRNSWWEQKASAFAPEYASRIANRYELLLFFAYRIAIGEMSLKEVCYNSSSIGNFYDSPNKSDMLEKSGVRDVGGARDGLGNTRKLVKTSFDFECFGGCFRNYGYLEPVAKNMGKPNDYILNYNSGIVVLTKIDKLIGVRK